MRRTVPIAITMIVGFIMVFKFFFENQWYVHAVGSEIEKWGIVIAAIAYVLGVANLTKVNGRVILRRGRDWPYKLVLLIAMFAVILIGVVEFHYYRGGAEPEREALWFAWVFDYLVTPLSATMFSLLAFFIASAAFRAFRARSFEATLLLIAGILVMIGRVPLGYYLTGGAATEIQVWILKVPSLAGQRAIIIGAAMGMVSAALRIVLGIERPYLK